METRGWRDEAAGFIHGCASTTRPYIPKASGAKRRGGYPHGRVDGRWARQARPTTIQPKLASTGFLDDGGGKALRSGVHTIPDDGGEGLSAARYREAEKTAGERPAVQDDIHAEEKKLHAGGFVGLVVEAAAGFEEFFRDQSGILA